MNTLSTLCNSFTKLCVNNKVSWHPQGVTSVRFFTLEPCDALPTRSLKRKPVSIIKKKNPEEACPFTIIPEPSVASRSSEDKQHEGKQHEGKHPEDHYEFKLIATLEHPSEIDPEALNSYKTEEDWVDINPDYFHCHTLAYIKYISDKQLEEETDSNDFYKNSELPLSFIEKEEEVYSLYD